ncbi:hypothetical protein RFM99_16055 [Mesorhizobium sp. VK4C]|uniref:hypothetical protein n=1 Tax=Mesorhizobium captivum TaxID=3072319 RepID=UPI002A23B4D0|nr:hypothetical protein [Mesorhizobium sp. VK4C]MDX8499921.1 hypothetical protein [Mesorhizobium sp. VK4C]
MKGSSLGWQGRWGTTYAVNLRDSASSFDEERLGRVPQEKGLIAADAWYQVQAMNESDLRSVYLYIKSLGPSGESAPYYRPPGKEPRTPYITLVPPQTPKK